MKHRLILVVGAVLITTVILLATLLYYFNQDTCPRGTFPCENSTQCLAQAYQCDGTPQCPSGDDELGCVDTHADWDFLDELDNNTTVRRACEFEGPPENCNYTGCAAVCEHWRKIPQTLQPDIKRLVAKDGSIEVLMSNALDKYTELRTLDLSFNGIRKLELRAFEQQDKLESLILMGNEISEILPEHLNTLRDLRIFYANNNKITTADLSGLDGCRSLEYIKLHHNLITNDGLRIPRDVPELSDIYLNDNRLEVISESLFSGCPSLKTLNVANNAIRTIEANAFQNISKLTELNLAQNQLMSLHPDTFKPLSTLTMLWLGHNPLEELPDSFFTSLPKLGSLHFEGLSVTYSLKKNAFDGFTNLDFVYFTNFHFCATYASNVKKCSPATDGVSSLSHLLGKPLLRAAVWSISTVTCLGNLLVLWGRFTARDENKVLSIVIRNLAVADFLMGVYLLGIAIQDVSYRDTYKTKASAWMSSPCCIGLGVLGMTSSQVSLFILAFMSVERFFVIVPPMSHWVTPRPIALMMMSVFWLIGISMALGPAIYWWNSTKFYGINGMCFPLYIDDPYLVGWQYSAFVFIGLNFVGVLIIVSAYAGMFVSIWRTQRATLLPASDSEFAVRLFLIVFTNALCWAPIIALKVQAMMNYPVPPDLHAWIVTFIVPINSAVNPLLYTFTTTRFRERLNGGWFGRVRHYFAASLVGQGSQISTLEKNSFPVYYQSRRGS